MGNRRNEISAFIGPGAFLDGELAFEGMARVDGRLKGRVSSEKGLLVVGEHGRLDAVIDVDRIVIAGAVRGEVKAASRVEIQKTARLHADVCAPVVTMDKGAVFDGACHVGAHIDDEKKPGDGHA